jgi:hypothetical protein
MTCWSNKPQQRCELSVLHHIFSMTGPYTLVKCPPVGHKNLIQLAEELLYTFLVLPLDPGDRGTLRTMQEYISNVVSRDGTSPTSLPSVKVAMLAETFHKVSFPCCFFFLGL